MVRCMLSTQSEQSQSVMVRVFGQTPLQKYGLNDRDEEVKGLQIATAAGSGAPLLALFENGCVLGYFTGRPVEYKDLRNPKIARSVY